jgi:hypothetical protein
VVRELTETIRTLGPLHWKQRREALART